MGGGREVKMEVEEERIKKKKDRKRREGIGKE